MALAVAGSSPVTHPHEIAMVGRTDAHRHSTHSLSPSSSGPGLRVFDPATGVRLPLGTQGRMIRWQNDYDFSFF